MGNQVTDHERLARFVYEMGLLKRAPRTGWFLAGVEDPETIAEHSFRTAMIGSPMEWKMVGISAAMTVLLLVLGVKVFRRTERIIADVA